MYVVRDWIGNSQAVAAKHYLQVTDEHFEQAAVSGANSVQYTGEIERSEAIDECESSDNSPVFASLRHCTSVHVGDTGLERLSVSPKETACSAESAALALQTTAPADFSDPGLTVVATAWPKLPAASQKSILAIVRKAVAARAAMTTRPRKPK